MDPVTVLEQDPVYVGGISRTATYKGFAFDIGGHRFFPNRRKSTRSGRNCSARISSTVPASRASITGASCSNIRSGLSMRW
jgi:hypothetical protein